MQKLLPVLLSLMLCLGSATGAWADDYGDIAAELRSLNIDAIINAANEVDSQPVSDVNYLFKSVTQLLKAVVVDNGGTTNTIREILEEYGLSMGQKLGRFSAQMDGNTNLFTTSTKSLNDLRDFLDTWKANIVNSITLLDNIPSNFTYTMTLPDGVQMQLDYTDALVLKGALQAAYSVIELLCSHNMDASVSALNSAAKQNTALAGGTFLQYRSNASGYLSTAKTWCKNSIATLRRALTAYTNEDATPANTEETFVLEPGTVSILEDALEKLAANLASGTPVELDAAHNDFDVFDLNEIFDGHLSIAKFLPYLTDEGIQFSTTGHLLGDDPTLDGMFPYATQAGWNIQWTKTLGLFPYISYWGKGTSMIPLSQMREAVSWPPYSFTMDMFWKNQTVDVSSGGAYLSIQRGENVVGLDFSYDNYDADAQLYILQDDDKIVFRYVHSDGDLQYVVTKEGDISVTTRAASLRSNVFAYGDGIDEERNFELGSATGHTSLLLSQTGAVPGSGVHLAPTLQLLLLN